MLDTAREKKLQTYLKAHPEQKKREKNVPVSYGGQLNLLDEYLIPIDEYLIHNIRNGRFRSELLEKEEQLKRRLDPTKKADQKVIASLLLEQNSSETDALKADLIKNGQIEAGIITVLAP